MSSRTFKKHANEKLNTNTANKRGHKKKEVVTSLSLNNNDDSLDSVDNSKSKKSKKSHTASYEKNDATVTLHKKIKIQLLHEIEETESSQSHIRSKAIISDDFNSTLISAPLRPSVTRAISIHTMSILNDDFIPFNGSASHSLIPASSGSLQALNSDNSFMLNTPNIPSTFKEMTIYQLCQWLCKNQNVLQLVNTIQNDKIKAGHDFLEELKSDGIEWLRVRNRHFGDFRNKLLDGTEDLIELFKAT
ncbi:84_t:CDS:2, partial [Cetraspora pellucida]